MGEADFYVVLAKETERGINLYTPTPVPAALVSVVAYQAALDGFDLMFQFDHEPALEDVIRHAETSAVSAMPGMMKLWVLDGERLEGAG